MKKRLATDEIVADLTQMGFMIDSESLKSVPIDVPIIKQVALLLSYLEEKEIKLTAKGKLPSKIVKELAFCDPSEGEADRLSVFNRFIEDEQRAAQRTRNLCEVAKLVKVSKGKMQKATMYQAYKDAPLHEKYIYLFDSYKKLNLAYFDGYQEEYITSRISFIMMQLLRDRQKSFRTPAVYLAFLLEDFPFIESDIEEQIDERYLLKDRYEIFEDIMSMRLFKNYMWPLGLIKERGEAYGETYEVEKTALLDALLLPLNALNIDQVLDKKSLSAFGREAKSLGIESLFEDFSFFYMRCLSVEFFSPQDEARKLVKSKKLLGEIVEKQELFYSEFASCVIETFKYFTQLEAKGGGNTNMQGAFESFVDGLQAILPKETPFSMIQSLVMSVLFFAENIRESYGVQMQEMDFAQQLNERFDEEVIEDIGLFLYNIEQFEKKFKKSKRINTKMQGSSKEVLMSMVLAVMSIHTFVKDGFI